MAKWRKTVTAGDLVIEAVYPRINAADAPRVRAEKKKLSTEAQSKINYKYSWQKLMLMLAANFRAGDLVVTLTFAPERRPDTRAGCAAAMKRFRARVKRVYKNARLQEPVMVWAMESRHGDGFWHVHAVISSSGKDFRLLQSCWPEGTIHIERLKVDKDHGYYEGLARYLCKEYPEKVGQRAWSYTRNARKPERDTQRVDDDTPLRAPRGATVTEEISVRTDYGCYYYVCYLLPGWERRKRTKGRRKGGGSDHRANRAVRGLKTF